MLPRLRLLRLLPLLLVGLLYHTNAQQHQISGTSLYPEELIPLITRADALLTAGQFNDAARAYSEAIGEYQYSFFRRLRGNWWNGGIGH